MGITERKERDKQEMRKQILSTAMNLFLEEGFSNVSIRRIAEKIEYSPATIYLYFKDKDEILYALHNEGFDELYRRQQEILTIKDPWVRLKKHGEIYLKFALENPEYYNLMFIMRSPIRKVTEGQDWSVGLRSYDLLKSNIQECIDKKIFKKVDVDIATFAIWSSAHGIAALILRHRCPMMECPDMAQIAQRALDFINVHLFAEGHKADAAHRMTA